MNKFLLNKSAISYYPELGGLVSGLIVDGQEILYCDESTLTSGSIRGGIPSMLPNSGIGNRVLPRHGIAQTSLFTATEDGDNLTLTLDRNQSIISPERYSIFPHDFVYELNYKMVDHGCIITQTVTNPTSPLSVGEGSGMRMGFGLHPYFPTPLSIQQIIGGVMQDLIIDHDNGDTAMIANQGTIVLQYETYQLLIECSDIYQRLRQRTPPGHNAICIEPVTHDVGQYFDHPIIISPGGTITGTMQLTIQAVIKDCDLIFAPTFL